MFSTDDTIVAIATPPGRAGIGVIRISGPDAIGIAARLTGRPPAFEPRRATFTRVQDLNRIEADTASASVAARHAAGDPETTGVASRAIDQAVVTVFPAPGSYTGEDVVELAAHGSPLLLERIVASAVRAGARLAAPGEFTLRAFLNGRMDLVQAEAVADLIDAVTPAQARQAFDQLEGTLTRAMAQIGDALFDLVVRLEASLDFPDEGYHFIVPEEAATGLDRVLTDVRDLLTTAHSGRVLREGRQVAIIGGTNVGKSSLFNVLVGANRAIVTDIAGTTRDLLTERSDIDGIPVTLVDTAGLRETEEVVEREGVIRARGAAAVADLSLIVLDGSMPLRDEDRSFLDRPPATALVVINKVDLPRAWTPDALGTLRGEPIEVSVRSGHGVSALRQAMCGALVGQERLRDTVGLSNIRHIELLRRVEDNVRRARDQARARSPEEFVLADVHDAMAALDEITGKRSSEDVLQAIFGRFCIGK